MAGGEGPLAGRVCVVTGASRGIGKGIALQLSAAGATVYITGRNREALEAAAAEVRARGGKCVPVSCDSSKEAEVAALFDRVRAEQGGRLDVLVNNAFSGVGALTAEAGRPFWEGASPAALWDQVNGAGLRGHYLCAAHAARLMAPAGRGLMVVISSPGGLRYMFGVAYGVGKAACDRLAADTAVELRPFGVASVSLWPGLVRTEALEETAQKDPSQGSPLFKKLREKLGVIGESPEVSGKCVVALASDPGVLRHSGKVLLTPELARRYRFKDVDGREVFHYLSVRELLSEAVPSMAPLFRLLIPGFVTVPKWALSLYASKFAVYRPILHSPPKASKKD
ncbi:dehydrogenase/reductase SDR family member 1 [Sceloporus undulatus]|uniref:dehydrogenase/reductase SDR family member 1 n=1 Tax=Sceloporus undulatus TaxID=8520 RepID=UPI001C4B5F56|nr:dehydrogenase/reductase SDR family member 1 [Sceloporus undulatus]